MNEMTLTSLNTDWSSRTVDFLVKSLRGWVRRDHPVSSVPDGVDPAEFTAITRRNRLLPLMSRCLALEVDLQPWVEALRQFELAYEANLINAYRHLRAGTILAARIEATGVPCLSLRGPFAGLSLYEDAGVRFFTDIDLLVPVTGRRAALVTALAAGYVQPERSLPFRFFERAHLHWRLDNPAEKVVCELHWALDHAYRPFKVDYAAIFTGAETREADGFRWREPQPEYLFLASSIHLAKHCRVDRRFTESEEFIRLALEQGWIHYWLDILVIARKHGASIDWDRVTEEAAAWSVSEAVASAISGAAHLAPGVIPSRVLDRLAAIPLQPASRSLPGPDRPFSPILVRTAAMGGFAPERLHDVWDYILRPTGRLPANPVVRFAYRAVHGIRSGFSLGVAALIFTWYCAVGGVRNMVRRRSRKVNPESDVSWREKVT